MNKPVKVRSAPGLIWRKRPGDKFEARWQARTDMVAKGFKIKSMKLWVGTGDPTKEEWDFIADTCNEMQQEMLVFSRGGLPQVGIFDGTVAGLMSAYKSDPDSPYQPGRSRYRLLRYPQGGDRRCLRARHQVKHPNETEADYINRLEETIGRMHRERFELDRRIHNQRISLRSNWEIVEMRSQNWIGSREGRRRFINLLKRHHEILRQLRIFEEQAPWWRRFWH